MVDLKVKMVKHEGGISSIISPVYNKNKEEALMALVMLGFAKAVAERAIEKAIKQHGTGSDNVENLVKAALKSI